MVSFISLVSVAFCLIFSIETTNAEPENVLIRMYFENLKLKKYNPMTTPTGNDGHGSPVNVLASMYLIDVHKVDDFSMDYRASLYFRQSWNDTRLSYENMDISSIVIQDVSQIWVPDLFFVQEKEGIRHDIISPNVFIWIHPDGEVKYSVRISVTFSCPMDFSRYPHDVQKCTFSAESYGRTKNQLMMDWDTRNNKTPVMKTEKINVLPFELTDIEHSAHDIAFSFGEYRRLDVTLTFKRKIGFFMTRLYIPFIILVALSWLSFWIKSKMAALRISLLAVIMYLMINIGSDISTYIPPAPYTKASDIWIAICESLVFAAFLEFIFVSILAKSEKKFEKKRRSSDQESPIIINSDVKEKTSHSEKMESAFKMVASRLSTTTKISSRVDTMASILFPLLFLIFNFVYWLVY